jgi:hypothetical protein
VERSLRYDAWTGCYLLQGESDSLALPTRAAADSAISRLANCDLCPTSRLDPTEDYQVSLQIAVRPLASDGVQSLAGDDSDRIVDANGVAFDLKALFGGAGREGSVPGTVLGRCGPFFRAADLREAP